MKTGTFMDFVGIHYDDIKKTYASRNNNGIKFNEDAFNEAFIKCSTKFGNSIITYDDVLKYFWVAYINTCKNEIAHNSKLQFCDEYSEIEDDCQQENCYENLYNDIMNKIQEEFSEESMLIYSLYKYHEWSKEDLIDSGYDCSNFEEKIKNIHRFVKEYCKKRYKEIYKKKSR